MTKQLVVITVDAYPELDIEELCRATGVEPDFIQELIEYGVIEPRGFTYETWRFDASHLRRIRTAAHLHRDLEVNIAGAAIILDLLDEMEEMKSELESFEKYFKL